MLKIDIELNPLETEQQVFKFKRITTAVISPIAVAVYLHILLETAGTKPTS
jgi:hypothetical protein